MATLATGYMMSTLERVEKCIRALLKHHLPGPTYNSPSGVSSRGRIMWETFIASITRFPHWKPASWKKVEILLVFNPDFPQWRSGYKDDGSNNHELYENYMTLVFGRGKYKERTRSSDILDFNSGEV